MFCGIGVFENSGVRVRHAGRESVSKKQTLALTAGGQVFVFVFFAAEPELLMPDGAGFRKMHIAIFARYHVGLLQGVLLPARLFSSLLEFPDHAQAKPDNHAEDNESDQAHKKSL